MQWYILKDLDEKLSLEWFPGSRVWQDSTFSYLDFFSCKTDFIFGIYGPENGILGVKKSKNYNFRFE